MFCPLINQECRKDCVFCSDEICEIKETQQLQDINSTLIELNDGIQKLSDILIESAKW
ncbi:MAG: hypothetical protein HFG29_10400 [Eubacterium sp.]|nr:hypothetical protein [Eubacterium sp.]